MKFFSNLSKFIAIVFSLFFIQASSQTKITDKLIGTWEGIDSAQEMGSIIIKKDNVMQLVLSPSESIECGYKIDTTKSPMLFDILIEEEGEVRTMKGLLLFINNDTIKWEIFMDRERTPNFSAEASDNIILLHRKK